MLLISFCQFTKPRYGGAHGAALKPNLGVARTHATKVYSQKNEISFHKDMLSLSNHCYCNT